MSYEFFKEDGRSGYNNNNNNNILNITNREAVVFGGEEGKKETTSMYLFLVFGGLTLEGIYLLEETGI